MTPNNISEAFAESVKEAIDGTVDMLLSTVEEIGGVRCFRTRGMEPLVPRRSISTAVGLRIY